MQDVAHSQSVAATGPSTLAVTWGYGSVSHVDLAGLIVRGGRRFTALGNALIFAGAAVGPYGGDVTWDDDEGDLAIDSEHLRTIAEHRAPFDAAAAARWQEDIRVSNAEAADFLGVAPSTWAAHAADGAELHLSGKSRSFMHLQDAVIAFYGRPDDQQSRATIRIPEKGTVYRLADIRHLHDIPQKDGHEGRPEVQAT